MLVHSDDVDRRGILGVVCTVGDREGRASGVNSRPLVFKRRKPKEFDKIGHPVSTSKGRAALFRALKSPVEGVPVGARVRETPLYLVEEVSVGGESEVFCCLTIDVCIANRYAIQQIWREKAAFYVDRRIAHAIATVGTST